mmetsp:Transcript_4566/g.11390  ORF Transcript_4566/g.11390 Transcript_4566/m.11390 type:complete len:123 (+) Transcript_4566:199-567(+)
MKWTSLKFRETQPEWFGKSGIGWHGIMMMEKYVPEDDGAVAPDQCCITYYDFLTGDKKEDAFALQSMLHAALHMHKKDHPHLDRCDIETDGAVCYSGNEAVKDFYAAAIWINRGDHQIPFNR